MTQIQIGTKVYYTGDMANQPGFLEVVSQHSHGVWNLQELPGGEDRKFCLFERQIGHEYQGHCNPRFVTMEAREKFYNARIAEAKLAANRASYLANQAA